MPPPYMELFGWGHSSHATRLVAVSVALGGALFTANCLGDPVGPSNLRIISLLDSPDTVWSGAPGEVVAHPVVVRVTDAQGNAVSGAMLSWRVQGHGATILNASTSSDLNGEATAQWYLGTRSKELQVLRVTAQGVSSQSQVVFQAKAVPHIVARLMLPIDSLHPLRVGDTLPIPVQAIDPYGNTFPAPAPVVSVDDTTIAILEPNVVVGGPRRGRTVVHATSGGVAISVPLHVTQFVSAITPVPDTLRIGSVGVTLSIPYVVRDDRDRPVIDTSVSLSVGDSGVVQPTGAVAPVLSDTATLSFVAVSNGSTHVTLSVPGVSASMQVIVAQVPASIDPVLNFAKPILTLSLGAVLPLTCTAVDSNGSAIPSEPVSVSSRSGAVTGSACESLRVSRSGIDTLVLTAGPARLLFPVAVAAGAVPSAPLGEYITADTIPAFSNGPWAPSARLNSQGQLEVYYAAYSSTVDSSGFTRGDLQRLVWLGGTSFRYDGVVLQHDDDICSPQGQGIENMAIVPRTDGVGWRMVYSAGSNACYGWQVFSAISTDERTWVKERGIRMSNGGTAVHGQPPWPVGEGLVIDQLPSGEWRAIVGNFEHIDPPEDHWQITEWRSADQITWEYVCPVLTTRDMPAGWQGSVYSPTIKEFAPGIWRMIFTARGDVGRSALWSAVSTDREHWQVEGELLGDVSSNLYYAALAGDHLVFIRQDNGGRLGLAMATVEMP